MLKELSDPKVDWLIKILVNNDKLLDMKPVIAGGFALSVLRALRLYNSQDKWSELKRAEAYYGCSKTFLSRIDTFGDVDFWFFEDHAVHNKGELSWVMFDKSEPNVLQEPFNSKYRVVRSTKWANSFRSIEAKDIPIIQIIKKPISSIENLFESFDFKNCCVAYHDGVLYYDEDLISSFNKFELTLNNDENYIGESIAKRVYSGLRAFKYAKRYMLDFSEALSELIFDIYLSLDDVDYNDYQDKVVLRNNVYGTTLMSSSDLHDMVKTFESNFRHFTRMKTFKGEYAIYLLERKNLPGLREYFGKDESKRLDVFPF